MKRGMIINHIIIFCLHLILIILCFSHAAQSDTIWKICSPDPKYSNTHAEFININQRIIEYVIIREENMVWEGFPKSLYPCQEELQKSPEIRIDYKYSFNYTYTNLTIRASESNPYEKQYLSVYRKDESLHKGKEGR